MGSVIITKLDTSSRHKRYKMVYRIDTGNDGDLMPLIIFKILFPSMKKDQLNGTKYRLIVLHYNKTSISSKSNTRINSLHAVFVFPGNNSTLLGMPDIEL